MNKEQKQEIRKAKIIVDSREMNGGVPKALDLFCPEVEFEIKTLDIGDYVLSERLAVERKSDDFWPTFFDRRELFSQLSDLKSAYEKAVLILEGNQLYSRNIDPNVIRGIVLAISVDMGIPIIYTADKHDTAQYLARMAIREQIDEKKPISLHGKRSHMSEDEQREYIVSAICNIGPVLSRALLKCFGNVENVISASESELQAVKDIGPVTARNVRNIVGGTYGKK